VRLTIPLSFAPFAAGTARLRVVARVGSGPDSATVDAVVDVRDRRWSVLFFDRRPSWMSTFVRRSLEGNHRFAVASRIATSRSVSTSAGNPPSSLEDPTLLELYDAVVVGAPEALSEGDVAGLETFLRRRGGRVLMLFDESVGAVGPYRRLTKVERWSTMSGTTPMTIDPVQAGAGTLRATELMWPASDPVEEERLAEITVKSDSGTPRRHPIVWHAPIGAGEVMVSGALDAWKFRDAAASDFDRFWRTTMAEAASAAVPPLEIRLSQSVVKPGESIDFVVAVRDATLADAQRPTHTSVSVNFGDGRSDVPVRMWPSAVAEFHGQVRAPAAPGSYRLRVVANGASETAAVVVQGDVERTTPDERDVMPAWIASHGGKVIPLNELRSELMRVAKSGMRADRWHPMRAWWWIVVFAGLLSVEWWWRRRQGLV
jgi:hypothetical protein